MEKISFENLLLKVAFACMVCDGAIDNSEITLIQSVFKSSKFLDKQKITDQINSYINELNSSGNDFFKNFFSELEGTNFSKEEELSIIFYALKTIYADFEIKYDEVKFFKIIRAELKLSNEEISSRFFDVRSFVETNDEIIIDGLPSIDIFIEEDMFSENNLEKLKRDYFSSNTLKKFENIISFDDNLLHSV